MIEINGIHKRFHNQEVLKGVSLSVKAGEVVCLIGPSGSGKSTVLRCINGFETYDAGSITIDAILQDSAQLAEHSLRCVFSLLRVAARRTRGWCRRGFDIVGRVDELSRRVGLLVRRRCCQALFFKIRF